MPQVYEELSAITARLEQHFHDAQDFEFTVENGKLFLLQTRSAKRSATAAVKIAVDMAREKLISKEEALRRIKASSIAEILSPQIDFSSETPEAIAHGLPASPGSAVGRIALSADAAVEAAGKHGEYPVILVTQETTADDIHGMAVAVGFLTAQGGATSHAAVVARGMGKCCITGAKGIVVDQAKSLLHIGDLHFQPGDWLSLDGSTGRVFAGKLPLRESEAGNAELDTLLGWSLEANFDPDPGQCGYSAGRCCRAAGRGSGHRTLPHRTHVFRVRPPSSYQVHDPCVERHGSAKGSGQAAAHAASGF